MSEPIAVIGAGMCGLTCASALQEAGRRVTVYDKSRGVGGRLATRRVPHRGGELAFDHGAPEATGDDPAFLGWLADLGAVARDGAALGLPGMSGLLRPLARTLDIRAGAEVAAVTRDGGGWTLDHSDGSQAAGFGAVVLAIPAPQALRLLPDEVPGMARALASVSMAPCWTLLAAFDTGLAAPDLILGAGDIARAERQSSRPGRSDAPEAWVAHFAPEFTRAHLETGQEAVLPLLMDRFADAAGPLPSAAYAAAHRWRFARTEVPLGAAFAGDPAAGLLAGGDWALGPNAIHAWKSGRAMAGALLSA
jgi:predicted NAD/FAD-dependent oxidoreductase